MYKRSRKVVWERKKDYFVPEESWDFIQVWFSAVISEREERGRTYGLKLVSVTQFELTQIQRRETSGFCIISLSGVSAKGPESGGKGHQIQCPFHPDVQILRATVAIKCVPEKRRSQTVRWRR